MIKNIYKYLMFFAVPTLVLLTGACEEDEEIRTNDIQEGLVQSTIDPLSETSVEAGTQYTITGNNLDLVTSVMLAGNSVSIESKDKSSLTFNVPRIFPIGPVSVTNKFRQVATTEETLAPVYEQITITSWPGEFMVGEPITIEGSNVHLINKVTLTIADVNTDFHPASLIGTTFEVDINGSSSDGSSIDVPTRGLAIPYGATVVASAEGYSGITENANSPNITAIKPSETFIPEQPIVLWDFEDGVNPVTDIQNGATASLNGGTGIPQALGDNYLTVKKASTGGWTNFGVIQLDAPVDADALSKFHEPHISFMVNSASSGGGYFELADNQGNWYHFTVGDDDYKFVTEGDWEWRSYDLNEVTDGQDLDLSNFQVTLTFKSGNVGNGGSPEDYEMNVDHIMITDGPVSPVAVESFESYTPDFGSINGGAVNAVHLDNYFHHSLTVSSSWIYQGGTRLEGPLNLGELSQPFLNLWINTGGGTAYFQVETVQNGNKFGYDPNGYELYDTDGEWQLITINLAEVIWSTWDGEGNFDPQGVSDYFAINFTTGNQESGSFEFNLDGLTLSDGPMFYYPEEE